MSLHFASPALTVAWLLAALAAAGQDAAKVEVALAPDAALTLEAFWEPCRSSKYNLFQETEALRQPRPAEERKRYDAAAFTPLLPVEPFEVGALWSIDAEAIVVFLKQFHPGARAELHHGGGAAPGAWACLRAASPERIEILLRAHAEFELEGGITYTPAQFEGRLLLDRRDRSLISFHLALPDRNTNVDVNVPAEFSETRDGQMRPSMAADIGWVPRMELVGGEQVALSPASWERSISDAEARLLLARRFYACAVIDWLPFDEAVLRSRGEERPLHVIVLFGALDDESC